MLKRKQNTIFEFQNQEKVISKHHKSWHYLAAHWHLGNFLLFLLMAYFSWALPCPPLIARSPDWLPSSMQMRGRYSVASNPPQLHVARVWLGVSTDRPLPVRRRLLDCWCDRTVHDDLHLVTTIIMMIDNHHHQHHHHGLAIMAPLNRSSAAPYKVCLVKIIN